MAKFNFAQDAERETSVGSWRCPVSLWKIMQCTREIKGVGSTFFGLFDSHKQEQIYSEL